MKATPRPRPTPSDRHVDGPALSQHASASVLILAGLAGCLAGCQVPGIGAAPMPSVAPSATVAPLGAVPAPATCPTGNTVDTFAPQFGPGLGFYHLDVWLLGFSGPRVTLHLAGANHTVYGWPHPLTLAAAADVTQPITLSGQVVLIGLDPVLFSPGGYALPMKMITFDPQAATTAAGGWKTWTLYIFIRRRAATTSTSTLGQPIRAASSPRAYRGAASHVRGRNGALGSRSWRWSARSKRSR